MKRRLKWVLSGIAALFAVLWGVFAAMGRRRGIAERMNAIDSEEAIRNTAINDGESLQADNAKLEHERDVDAIRNNADNKAQAMAGNHDARMDWLSGLADKDAGK